MAGNKIVSNLMNMVPARYHDVDPVAKTNHASVIFILNDMTYDLHRYVADHKVWRSIDSDERILARDTLYNATESFCSVHSGTMHIIRGELRDVAGPGERSRYLCGIAGLREKSVCYFALNPDGTLMEDMGHPNQVDRYMPLDQMIAFAIRAPIVACTVPTSPSLFDPAQHRIQVIY